jgi:hypothetical protein
MSWFSTTLQQHRIAWDEERLQLIQQTTIELETCQQQWVDDAREWQMKHEAALRQLRDEYLYERDKQAAALRQLTEEYQKDRVNLEQKHAAATQKVLIVVCDWCCW